MEYTADMIDRIEEMGQAVYRMYLAFLQLNDADDLEVKFPWNNDIIEGIYGVAVLCSTDTSEIPVQSVRPICRTYRWFRSVLRYQDLRNQGVKLHP